MRGSTVLILKIWKLVYNPLDQKLLICLLTLIQKDNVIDLRLKVVKCLLTDSVAMVSLKKHIRPTRSVSVDSYHMNSKLSGPLAHEKHHHVVGPLHQKLNHASSLELTPKLEQVTS